jgi:hypothetical protein
MWVVLKVIIFLLLGFEQYKAQKYILQAFSDKRGKFRLI